MIDLRSDTLTRPTEAMRAAMARAEVGDDVYGEDPTVLALEERVAGLFGHEAALFTPTGSMANVLAVGSLVAPGQEVLCESSAHIARAELGAHGAIGGVTMRTWTHPRGQVDLAAIRAMFAPDMGPFFVRTAAISVENTHNFAGGAVLPLEDLQALRAWASVGRRRRAPRRRPDLERARRHRRPARGVRRHRVDVLSVCLSKGLGRPRRLADGRARATRSTRRGCGASGWAAGCARSASWPPPGCTPSTTTSSGWPTTTPTPGCWPRPAASTPRPSTPTSSWSSGSDAAAFVAAAARGGRPGRHRRPDRRPAGHPPRRVREDAAGAPRRVLVDLCRTRPFRTQRGPRRNDTSLIAVKSRAALPSPGGETVESLQHHSPWSPRGRR